MRRFMILLLILIACGGTQAATIHVPGDSATIQLGILGAVDGDTVLVAKGTYPDSNIALFGRDIVVTSEEGPDSTIIIGSFLFIPSDDQNPIVDGFTIRECGPNIICFYNSNPIIRNCIIRDGESDIGGGVMAGNATPRFENCLFTNNKATDAGSAIFAVEDEGGPHCVVEIVNCEFVENLPTEYPQYGGIDLDVSQGAEVYVDSTLFRGDKESYGSCVSIRNGRVHMTNCTVVDYEYINFEVENDTDGYFLEIEHSMIDFGEGIAFLRSLPEDSIAITESVLFGYGPVVPESTTALSGYIIAKPLFCDTTVDDYHISDTSPCTPDNNPWGASIGKYGVGCSLPFLCGDPDGNGTVSIADVVFIIAFMFGDDPEYPSPFDSADVDCSGTINMADAVYIIAYAFGAGPEPCAACP